MTVRAFDTDNMDDLLALRNMKTPMFGDAEIYPRRTVYGDAESEAIGLTPVEAVPNVLVPRDSYKEVIAECHEKKIFPLYHMYDSWCPKGTRWNQNGLGYCWTWSGTAAMMTVRAAEAKETIQLAPVSMGFLVGWANRGNYLESFIEGAREQGVAPASFVPEQHNNNPRSFKGGWDVERRKYKLGQVWDTNCRDGAATAMQHVISILAYGRPLYVAYYWWAHAVPIVAVRWDESKKGYIVVVIRNSHNEDDVIELFGSKAVPYEAFGFISTLVTE